MNQLAVPIATSLQNLPGADDGLGENLEGGWDVESLGLDDELDQALENEDQVDEEQTQKDGHYQQEDMAQDVMDAMRSQLVDVEKKLVSKEAEISNCYKQIQVLEKECSDLNQRLAAQSEDAGDARSKLSKLEEQLSAKEEEITNCHIKIKTLEKTAEKDAPAVGSEEDADRDNDSQDDGDNWDIESLGIDDEELDQVIEGDNLSDPIQDLDLGASNQLPPDLTSHPDVLQVGNWF